MNYIHLCLVALFAVLSYVSATCYSKGIQSGPEADLNALKAKLPIICRQFTGDYPSNSTTYRCVPKGSSQRYDLYVKNKSNSTTRLNNKICNGQVLKGISNCTLGSSHEFGPWEFK